MLRIGSRRGFGVELLELLLCVLFELYKEVGKVFGIVGRLVVFFFWVVVFVYLICVVFKFSFKNII